MQQSMVGVFLSPGTALGLRVTLKSTLSLLDYATSTLKYKYLLQISVKTKCRTFLGLCVNHLDAMTILPQSSF